MVIRKRWRDYVAFQCICKISLWLILGWFIFGVCIGFYRVEGEDNNDLRDGDLIIYGKFLRNYDYDDVVLYEKEGIEIARISDMNGGVIKGRVLALLRVRGIGDE